MADNALTLHLEGDVTIEDFAATMQHFAALVSVLSKEVAGTEVQWVITELHAGSATTTIEPIEPVAVAIEPIVEAFATIGSSLERHTPIPYSARVRDEALAITKVLKPDSRISSVSLETPDRNFVVVNEFIEGAVVVSSPRESMGIVSGVVQALNSRRGVNFTLYDDVFDKGVTCHASRKMADQLRNSWGKRVVVGGKITRDPTTGRPIKVKEIKYIRILDEVEPNSFKNARGVLPSVHEETSNETIRRLRNAE